MKAKCWTCGKRFPLNKEAIYQVKESLPISQVLTRVCNTYDAIDCPYCGCQCLLHVRLPKEQIDTPEQEPVDDLESTEQDDGVSGSTGAFAGASLFERRNKII